MIGRIKLGVVLLFFAGNIFGQKQAFLTDGGTAHWLDSISLEYQNYRSAQTAEGRIKAKSKALQLNEQGVSTLLRLPTRLEQQLHFSRRSHCISEGGNIQKRVTG